MTPHDPRDSFSDREFSPEERQDLRRLRYQWDENGWIVPIIADLAASIRRIGIIVATCAGIGAAIAWAVKSGWFQP